MIKRICAALGVVLAVAISLLPKASAQSIQDQINQQQQNYGSGTQQRCAVTGCGTTSTTATPKVSTPTVNPMATAVVGAISYQIGQSIGKALFGGGDTPAAPAVDPAEQARSVAAQQLNNSGLYLLRQKNYSGAINEFQKALAQEPGDATIQGNLTYARQQMKNTAIAGENSASLGELLHDAPVGTGSALSQVLGARPPGDPGSSASPLSLVNLSTSSASASNDPASLQSQLDGVLSNHAAELPVQQPQPSDIDLLFQASPSRWPGPQRPANEPKLVNPLDAENANADSTASTVNQLDSVLRGRSGTDLSNQMDQFNQNYLPAHPDVQPQPAASSPGPHN